MEAKEPSHVAAYGGRHARKWRLGAGSYLAVMGMFWFAAQALGATRRLPGHAIGPFLAVGLLLGALWAFGWGGGEWLASRLSTPPGASGALAVVRRIGRMLIPGAFSATVYLLIAVPLRAVSMVQLSAYCALPVVLAGLFEARPPEQRLGWQDLVVLAALALPIEYGWLRAPAGSGLGGVPKLLLADVGLYVYLIQRRLPGIGFDLRLDLHDWRTGLREWALFAPLAIALGLALGFLRFHARLPASGSLAATVLVTFLFVAVPEEVFFRGLLQNLLQTRLPRRQALALASVLFGLSHYVHGLTFNWRYVILASIAGWFYGRAWMRSRRVGASAITHTLVDAVWVTWFFNPGAL